jgi:hypothetical protein
MLLLAVAFAFAPLPAGAEEIVSSTMFHLSGHSRPDSLSFAANWLKDLRTPNGKGLSQRPWVCIPCVAMAGALILDAVFPFLLQLPLSPLYCVGPSVGAVTCAIGCVLEHREQSVLATRM